jgi:tRNA(fMet)-specific endonuclease VapC
MSAMQIDTNVYTAFKRNEPVAVRSLQVMETIGINVIVLGELLSGFRGGTREQTNRLELNEFLDSSRVDLIAVDEETAEMYSLVYATLKKKGVPIPSNDMWIAASAMRYGSELVTFDNHFTQVEGLLLKVLAKE